MPSPPKTTSRRKSVGLSKTPDIYPHPSASLKSEQLGAFVVHPPAGPGAGAAFATAQGVPVDNNHHSFQRSPSSLQPSHAVLTRLDIALQEKLASFGQERIAERVVYARGAGAHGYFKPYKPLTEYTSAAFLQDPEVLTPVFVRFSNLTGAQGSADTVRDVRGFAVKFYTGEGNFDLVGHNMPVSYVQDALKFPDLVHALKSEPDSGLPQASNAHDTFWDFVSLMPETTHMLMWVMSSRGLPRSFRMMEGFGVHTFSLVNSRGESHCVRFHWRPRLGVHALAWDEAQTLSGHDPDFYRRDLWQAIEDGHFPEWELGVQIIPPSRLKELGFDLMDATKLIPEHIVPVQPIGRLTLNRNPVNFFAETEQIAFNPAHLVPGIDFSSDPLLQGRLLAYASSQQHRLGGANFAALPINRSVCPFYNFQRDGLYQNAIPAGRVAYEPNTLNSGAEFRIDGGAADFKSSAESALLPMGRASRSRSPEDSFGDHFSQAAVFWQALGHSEKDQLVAAFQHGLSKVQADIRQRVVNNLAHADSKLATRIATALGIAPPDAKAATGRMGFSHYQAPAKSALESLRPAPEATPSTSLPVSIKTRKIAILVADGVEPGAVRRVQHDLEAAGATCLVLAAQLGTVSTAGGRQLAVAQTFAAMPSVFFDGVLIPGGAGCAASLLASSEAAFFVQQAFRHSKTICALDEGAALLAGLGFAAQPGILLADTRGLTETPVSLDFIAALALHRHWERINQGKE